MRLLQEEVNRLAQSTAAPRASFPAINVYAHQERTDLSIAAARDLWRRKAPSEHWEPRPGTWRLLVSGSCQSLW